MVLPDNAGEGPWKADVSENFISSLWMTFYQFIFDRAEFAGFNENLCGDADFTEVVNYTGEVYAMDVAMAVATSATRF
jgi:hypothetical protein